MHYPEIKRFVQEILGCSCPEEVFNKIDYQTASAGIIGSKINVGGRLLVYILTADGQSSIHEVVDTALAQGVRERAKKGFNRFRLVLAASRPDDLRSLAEQAFNRSGYADDKTHLHVVSNSDVKGF